MRILLVANPASRAGRGAVALQAAEARFRSEGVQILSLPTAGPGHARRSVPGLLAEADRVVACGGDGLVSEVAAALVGTNVPLAVIPAGRGNDFARALGLPLDVAPACRLAIKGDCRPIDVGLANGRPFLTVAACGLDAEVSRGARASRLPLPGPAAYLLQVLRMLGRPPRMQARVSVDGRDFGDELVILAVANTATYGGGFRIAPQARPDDGRLDACAIRARSRPGLLALLPRVLAGRHGTLPGITMLRGSRIEVICDPPLAIEGDGEPLAASPCTFECLPGALRVVGPGG